MENVKTSSESLKILFNDIQKCDSKTYSNSLALLISDIKKNNLSEEFIPIVLALVLCKRPQIPNKLVLFFRRIFEEVQETETGKGFIMDVFNELVHLIDSKIVRARRNALYLLKVITSIAGLTELLETSLLEKIAEKLFDKEKTVRKEALIILSNFQESLVHGNTPISNLFKNLCRFDPSNEVRKIAFQNLNLSTHTYKCIIERCIDVNLSIRSVFYKKYLNKISIRELDNQTKTFLFKRTYSEREFNAVQYLIDVIIEQYDLPTEFVSVVADFYQEKLEKIFRKLIFRLFDLYDTPQVFESIEKQPTIPSCLLYYYYLSYIEEYKGRDYLELPNLNRFTEYLYLQAKDAEDETSLDVVRVLFKIARMYDVFDDDSRKIISNAVFKLLKKEVKDEILPETVGLLYSIDSNLSDKLFGSVIYKNLEDNIDFSMSIARHLMSHSKKIDTIQKAIIQEIVYNNLTHKDSLYIIFYYLTLEWNQELFDCLNNAQETNTDHIAMMVDLTLIYKFQNLIDLTIKEINESLERENVDSLIPISKIILAENLCDKSIASKYLKFALKIYYSSTNDKIEQYLDIFFHRYLSSEPTLLVNIFFFVYESLEINHRIFVDQTFYWLENSSNRESLQLLYYNLCLNLYIYYENITNIKVYLNILNKIQMDERWTTVVTKKILFCCSQLLKKEGSKKPISELINRIMLLDDGEPISPEHLLEVKTDLLMG